MTKEVTLRQSGGSVSATLPKDMAARLHLEAGDRVLAVETDRGFLLTPYDPDVERALAVASKAAKKYRNALRELAKVTMARRRTEPRWLSRLVVDAIHADQIRQHGRFWRACARRPSWNRLLARPQQKWAYDEEPDIAVLAAAYAFGLVRNHPYRDGNKRIGFRRW